MKNLGRQLAAMITMVAVLAVAFPFHVSATTTQEKLNQAQQEKQETESKLSETKDNISGMQVEKEGLQGELSDLNSQLEEVSTNLDDLEQQISDKEADIETTQADLEEAKETEEWQYECMKARVKFMYERSDYAYMEMLFNATSFADFLNKTEYINKISEYDQNTLKQYQETKREIADKEEALEQEKEDLDDMKIKVVAEQEKVSTLVNKTSGSISGYSKQISSAEESALAYEAQLDSQEEDIAALKKKLAEEQAMSKLSSSSAKRDISEVTFAEGDEALLAAIIYCEAGGESYEGKVAVGAVVINRVLSSVYPGTVVGVIYQGGQFSPVASGRMAMALANGSATQSCYQAADEAMAGNTNVGSCVYFRTPIEGLTGIQIGNHIFY